MPLRPDPLAWIAEELASLEARDLRRRLRTHDGPQSPLLEFDGRSFVNFGSNDYLGLAADRRLTQAVVDAAQHEGWGSGASPLVVGHGESHRRLEQRLAQFEGTEAALGFSSGFAANVGAVSSLVGAGDAVYSDSLNHASLVDGCRWSRAAVHVYRHADAGHLQHLLGESRAFRRRLIVTDSVFSMDGDLAPLAELAELADRFHCMLMVDEAHATGVFGEHGRGLAESMGVEDRVDVRVGTLSKALGCAGGFVCGSRELVDWLINQARPYVFSTAPPPAACAAALAAIDIVRDEPERRAALLAGAAEARTRLAAQGWSIGTTASQIVPLLVGEPARAVALSAELARRGYWVPAIRPPSVPAGQARLRIGLSYGHSTEQLDGLIGALAEAMAVR
ncbi:MAG TPA: 8-amino-7-oxononanoate synthase [Pirellulales bacterium]|nr:8-amino-7-oxononanoate synthase [Pirellulales bacterium]